MKVTSAVLHYKPGVCSLEGARALYFKEGTQFPDLHYIVREGQHIVNYTGRHTGKRVGISVPALDIRQVNTVL